MAKTDYFWTDLHQATERLSRTVVTYDGQPVYIELVEGSTTDDNIPRGRIRPCGVPLEESKAERKMLNSPKFKRFRDLPNLGWMNSATTRLGAVYMSRNLRAGGRLHGLHNGCIVVKLFTYGVGDGVIPVLRTGDYNFSHMMFDKGFVDSHNNAFPSLEKTLANIKTGTAIAFSRLYCVVRDNDGLRWMYRNDERVGIFTGIDTLNLISKYSYLREEIMSDPAFTINNLREF